MSNLKEWLRRIDLTDFPDKRQAKAGLRREFEGTDATLDLENLGFVNLFAWRNTPEKYSFWLEVYDSLTRAELHFLPELPKTPPAIEKLIEAAKQVESLRELAEAAEREML